MAEAQHPFVSIYQTLVYLGIDPRIAQPDYRTEDDVQRVALGIPDTKVGISLQGDRIAELLEDGWFLPQFTSAEIESFSKVMTALSNLSFEHIRRDSQNSQVKTGSREEEILMEAILRANIKTPDRNYRVLRENGNELTTPDFVWEEYKVAFFMDGLWWHQAKDDKRLLDAISEASTNTEKSRMLMEGNKTRAQRDAANRSVLASMGWTVLACTDADLKTEEGIQRQVKVITQALRTAAKLAKLEKMERRNEGSDESQVSEDSGRSESPKNDETAFDPFSIL